MPRAYASQDLVNLVNDDSGMTGSVDPGTNPGGGGVTTNESMWLTQGATVDTSEGWPFKVSYPGMDSAGGYNSTMIGGSGHTNVPSSGNVTDVTGFVTNDPHIFGPGGPTDSGLPPVTNGPGTLPHDSDPTAPPVTNPLFRDSDVRLTPVTNTTLPHDSDLPGATQPIEFPWRNADGIVNTNWHPEAAAAPSATPHSASSAATLDSEQGTNGHVTGYHFGDWHLL